MRAAPLKGDCIVCQAPEGVRQAVNHAIWPDGPMRAANYRAAGARAAAQAGQLESPPDDRYADLDVKTITRHADHTEASWREVEPGQPLTGSEVPIATDFSSVMEAGARVGMKALGGFEKLLDNDPVAFAALMPKEAIALSKIGMVAAGTKEASRLKRNQQAIDVMAIFGLSSGHQRPPQSGDDEDVASLEELHAEVDSERKRLTA